MAVLLKQWETIVEEFLDEIPTGAESRAARLLRQLAMEGGRMRTNSAPLGDGLFELKVKFNKMEYRLLYFFHDQAAHVVNCFIKKTRKTPQSELDLARKRMRLVKADTGEENAIFH